MTTLTSVALTLVLGGIGLQSGFSSVPVAKSSSGLVALDLGGTGGGLGRGGGGNRGGGGSSGGGGGGNRGGGGGLGRSGGGGNSGGGGSARGGGSSGGGGGGLGRSGGGNRGGGNSGGGNSAGGELGRSNGGNSGGPLGRAGGNNGRNTGSNQGNLGNFPSRNASHYQIIGARGRNGLSVNRAPIGVTQWSPRNRQSNYPANHDITVTRGLGRAQTINSAPYIDPRTGNLATLIQRQNQTRIVGQWRTGYYYYPYNGFSDDYFFFPGYEFNPYEGPCMPSPWYYYSCMPPYISYNQVIVGYSPFFGNFYGQDYSYVGDAFGSSSDFSRYAQINSNNTNIPSLNAALSDLESAFLKRDNNALERIIPARGTIPIFIDDKYDYSVSANDLYGMMRDNTQSVETTDYTIDNVSVKNHQARVLAEQYFVDAWGKNQVVYQEFMFKIVGNEALITQFGTSLHRPW